jgi:hypothetical protein
VLIAVGSGHQWQVIGGWNYDHPLDLLLNAELAPAYSTMEMVDAYSSRAFFHAWPG